MPNHILWRFNHYDFQKPHYLSHKIMRVALYVFMRYPTLRKFTTLPLKKQELL